MNSKQAVRVVVCVSPAQGGLGVDLGFCQGVKYYVEGVYPDGPGLRWGRVTVREVEGRWVGGPPGVQSVEGSRSLRRVLRQIAGVVVSWARTRCDCGSG